MQRAKLSNLYPTAFLTIELFVWKSGQTGSNQILTLLKETFLGHDGFVFYYPCFHLSSVLEIKSATVTKLYYGDYRAFHAAFIGIFEF